MFAVQTSHKSITLIQEFTIQLKNFKKAINVVEIVVVISGLWTVNCNICSSSGFSIFKGLK